MHDALTRITASLTLLTAVAVTGCGAAAAPGGATTDSHTASDEHDQASSGHSHIGPHNGHLIELGSNEEYHAELLHDETTHRVTVYILDGQAKENVPISQPELVVNVVSGGEPRQYKLAAVTQANELPSMASCFQLENEALCSALEAADAKGRLAVDINGKQFVGEIEHHENDDHGNAEESKE